MAELVVDIVVGKLANIIMKEIEFFGGVEEKVKRVVDELFTIQRCLKNLHPKDKGDVRVQNWLNAVYNVAYRIEDVTDTFFLRVEDNHQIHPKNTTVLQNIKKLQNKLGTELDGIQNELEEINKQTFDYGIKLLQDKGKGEAIVQPCRRATYQEVDEITVVGLQADKNKILNLMCAEETTRRTVITIVGTGGIGKTTLAHMVYKRARADFEYHIMLSISQQFNLTDLWKNMLLHVEHSLPEKLEDDLEALESKVKSFLSSRRYLIILDDVWTFDLWDRMKPSLPDAKNGSRVIITSRFLDVKSYDFEIIPYKLNFLDEKESLNLLLRRALPYQQLGEECPSHLLELAMKLSKKCKGLPLALIVLGGILSTKENSYLLWERVLQTMNWHSDGKDCMQVVAMSYENLPCYLKACFLYFALFPEDYEIPAKRLIRMWVAEGFIQPVYVSGRPTMEEMAKSYLEELFERSIIEVTSRHMNGSIKSFQVRGLLHDLAVHEAGHGNFITVFSQALDDIKPNKEIRRASLQFPQQDQQRNPRLLDYVSTDSRIFDTPGYVGQNTRSLLFFGFGRCFLLFGFVLRLPECSNFRLLRVLELVGVTNYADDLVRGLDELIQLKYLGFRNCLIEIPSCSFHCMRSLETLDVRGTLFDSLNNAGLWEIGTLRHVLCDGDTTAALPLDGPLSTANLSNLQSMRWVSPRREWDMELPCLNNLCMLGLSNPFDNWVTVTKLLHRLPSLVSLGIKGVSLPMEIVYPQELPNYRYLKSLYLEGNWSENVTLKASFFPPHLVKLTLIQSLLDQNPMPELGKLPNLKKLCLREQVRNYAGPTICPQGFRVLQYLEVGDSSIKNLIVERGVMPKLTYLKVHNNIEFNLSPVLQQVTVVIR